MSDEVIAFLTQGGLSSYAGTLVENGFDTMDQLAIMDDTEMMNLGIKLGHRRKLQLMIAERFAYNLTQPYPLFGCGPHNMAPVLHAMPPIFHGSAPMQPCSVFGWPFYCMPPMLPGIAPVICGSAPVFHHSSCSMELPVTSQPIKVRSSTLEELVDVETVLQICVFRLLHGADVDIPQEMKIFSDHGDIGRICGVHLKTVIELRKDLAKKTSQLSCTNIQRQHQLMMFRRQTTEQVKYHMNSVVTRLQTLKMSGTSMPSAEESERAAVVFVNKYYMEEQRRLLNAEDRRCLEASHDSFTRFFKNSNELIGLGEALLHLGQVACLAKMAHAVRNLAILVAVRRAGGHSDRSRFEREVGSIVPSCLQKRTLALKVSNLRSDVFLCYAKLLGDVPGAFQSNCQQAKQVRPKKVNRNANLNEREPEPEHSK